MQNINNILILADTYLPGYKGGGPIRSISNLVTLLGEEYNFQIVTSDRDLNSSIPYDGIEINSWQRVGNANILYLSPNNINFIFLFNLIRSVQYDILYLNSFFSLNFSIIPIIIHRFCFNIQREIIIAPRGQFSRNALMLKSKKKYYFLKLATFIRLYKNVIWQASSIYEMDDIQRIIPKAQIKIAPALSSTNIFQYDSKITDEALIDIKKIPGELKVLFLSRISPMKNLDGALRMLHGIQGKVQFNIYGPMEDACYWKKCEKIICNLSSNIIVQYLGEVNHSQVPSIIKDHHIFYLPTLGENYGHAIIEALACGRPVLISDKTPWRDLEKLGVGWDISLLEPRKFTLIIQRCIDMDKKDLSLMSKNALLFGNEEAIDNNILDQNRDLFRANI